MRVAPAPGLPESALEPLVPASLASLAPSDSGLRCQPPSAHFSAWASSLDGGGSTHITIRVVNSTGTPQRITVERAVVGDPGHPGDEAAFWVDTVQAGAVPPGLAQAFSVTFTPVHGPRYYFASVRLRAESGSLLYPLHAYPVASGFSLPRVLDFGRVPLGEQAVRVLTLGTAVPIPFAVAFQARSPHGAITLTPSDCLIPPAGSTQVTVTYSPTTLGTASAEYAVVTSTHAAGLGVLEGEQELVAWGVPPSSGAQYGRAAPLLLTVTGSCAPGMARDARLLQALAAERSLAAMGVSALENGALEASLASSRQWEESKVLRGQQQRQQQREGEGGSGWEGGQQQQQQQQQLDSSVDGSVGEGQLEEGENRGAADASLPPPALHSALQPLPASTTFFPGTPRATGTGAATAPRQRQERWLSRDPGLSTVDEQLASYKASKTAQLVSALNGRAALVEAVATEMHRATGAPVDWEGARAMVAERLGAPDAPVDSYLHAGGGATGAGGRESADAQAAQRRVVMMRGVAVKGGLAAQSDVDAVLVAKEGYIAPSGLGEAIAARREFEAAGEAAAARVLAAAREGGEGSSSSSSSSSSTSQPLFSAAPFSNAPVTFPSAGPVSQRTQRSLQGHTTAKHSATQAALVAGALPEAEAAAALRRAHTAAKEAVVGVGTALGGAALQAAVLGESWLFTALQGSGSGEWGRLLQALWRTGDEVALGQGSSSSSGGENGSSSSGGGGEGSGSSSSSSSGEESSAPDASSDAAAVRSSLLSLALTRVGGIRTRAPGLHTVSAAPPPPGTGLLPSLAALIRASAAPMRNPAALRATVYARECGAIEAGEAGRERGSTLWRGDGLMSAAAGERVRALRAVLRAMEAAFGARVARTARVSTCVPPVGHLSEKQRRLVLAPSEIVASSSGGSGSSTAARPLPASHVTPLYPTSSPGALLESPLLTAILLPARAPTVPAHRPCLAHPAYRPSPSDRHNSDSWSARRAAVARLQGAVSVLQARGRAEARVEALAGLLGGLAGGVLSAGQAGMAHEDVGGLTRAILASVEERGRLGAGQGQQQQQQQQHVTAAESLGTLEAVEELPGPVAALQAATEEAVGVGALAAALHAPGPYPLSWLRVGTPSSSSAAGGFVRPPRLPPPSTPLPLSHPFSAACTPPPLPLLQLHTNPRCALPHPPLALAPPFFPPPSYADTWSIGEYAEAARRTRWGSAEPPGGARAASEWVESVGGWDTRTPIPHACLPTHSSSAGGLGRVGGGSGSASTSAIPAPATGLGGSDDYLPTWLLTPPEANYWDELFSTAHWPLAGVLGHSPLPLQPCPMPTHCGAGEARKPLRAGALEECAAAGVLPLPGAEACLDAALERALAGAERGVVGSGRGATGVRWQEVQAGGAASSAANPHLATAVGVGVSGGLLADFSPAARLAPAARLLQPYLPSLPDTPGTLTGTLPAHAHGLTAASTPAGGALTLAQVSGSTPGLMSARALERPVGVGVGAPAPLPFSLHTFTPSLSAPAGSAGWGPLLRERAQGGAMEDGRPRYPTDVTPAASRVFLAAGEGGEGAAAAAAAAAGAVGGGRGMACWWCQGCPHSCRCPSQSTCSVTTATLTQMMRAKALGVGGGCRAAALSP